jgi:hypothetical protein
VQLVTTQIPDESDLHLPNAKGDSIWLKIPTCPAFLSLVNFTNHVIIINRCRTLDEKVFYILYGARERLKNEEMKRCIINDTYCLVRARVCREDGFLPFRDRP